MSQGSSTESYPAFARIGLRENPRKNLNQVTCPDRDSNPGHLVSQPDALTVTPQKPHRIIEHERDSPKVNVFCALSQRKLYGPFFFIEATVTGHSYLDMLEQWRSINNRSNQLLSMVVYRIRSLRSRASFERIYYNVVLRNLNSNCIAHRLNANLNHEIRLNLNAKVFRI
ncbi:hypothetical protein ANN_08841 [Periplaneta americana]|uniref:Uncharacterized protein n=1 Tax=Periplaneta americana TaxID=6978 RepID=A0ABQ8T380_PERAM|nr:hypothetical protein ANN_08841 [Periplaneta americana]